MAIQGQTVMANAARNAVLVTAEREAATVPVVKMPLIIATTVQIALMKTINNELNATDF